MLENYVKTTLRQLVKNKIYTLINVASLSLGIVCTLIIFSIIRFENSFDKYHEEVDNIFRMVSVSDNYGKLEYWPGIPSPMIPALRNDFPEIKKLTVVDRTFYSLPVISVKRKDGTILKYKEREVAFVNPDYFDIFKYEWLLGNSEKALEGPHMAALSESLVRKYFGKENPLGKTITYNGDKELLVTGVVKDVPNNTDLPFNILITYDDERGNDNWYNTSAVHQCYLKLPEEVDPQQIERRFDEFKTKHMDKRVAEKIDYRLQPLRKIHFDQRFLNFNNRTVTSETLLALGLIGIALLMTACINFINLNTALAVRRSKEVGVRKVLGGTRQTLVMHFLGETALIVFLSICFSFVVAEVAADHVEYLLGYTIDPVKFSDPSLAIFSVTLFILVTMGAGTYSALHLSRISPVAALRNQMPSRYGEGLLLRKGLVVVQFAVLQGLILSTSIIASQMSYLRNVDMGFNKEGVVEVDLPLREKSRLETLKNKLLQYASIKGVSFSNSGTASGSILFGDYVFHDAEENKKGKAQVKLVDKDFPSVYELEFLYGQVPFPTDSLQQYIVNQAFAQEVGYGNNYDKLSGKFVSIRRREGPIAAIVKDFHTTSLRKKVEPVIIMIEENYRRAGIKIRMQNISQALATIEEVWSSVYPEYVFEYIFLDERIAKFNEDDRRTASLINLFTSMAIAIGCMGLLGLVSHMAVTRTKEIGIRKVLGATFSSIFLLLSKELTVLILIAFAIAAPVGYSLMQNWLTNFAYRIDLDASLFLYTMVASFVIAFITVAYKAILTAAANPVENLRSE